MQPEIDDDEIDLGEVFLTWFAQWPVVLGSALSGLALAGVYAFFLAPSEYKAEAVLRAERQYFCPPVLESFSEMRESCSVTLASTIEGAAASAVLPKAVESLNNQVGLFFDPFLALDGKPATPVSISHRLAETVRFDIEGNSITISVRHSDEGRAVALANAIAGYMQTDIASAAARRLAEAEVYIRRKLSDLSRPQAALAQSEAAIAIERSANQARLEGISEAQQVTDEAATIARPAERPAEQTAPRHTLLLALGAILGLLGGLGAALLRVRRNGTLHTDRAIRDAFLQAGLPTKAIVRLDRGQPKLGWQEAWLALGEDKRVIAVIPVAPDRKVKQTVSGLIETVMTKTATALDLAGWFPSSEKGAVSEGAPARVRAAGIEDLPDALLAMGKQDETALLLAPRATENLAGLAKVLAHADAAIVVGQMGQITRPEVERIALAAQGRFGQIVILTV